jgi:hypothetical protein
LDKLQNDGFMHKNGFRLHDKEVDTGPVKRVSHCGTPFFKKLMEFMEFRDSIDLSTTAAAMSHPEPDESSAKIQLTNTTDSWKRIVPYIVCN